MTSLLSRFFNSHIYYLFVLGISFWGWNTANELSVLIIYLLIASYVFLTYTHHEALLPLLLFFPVIEGTTNVLKNLPIWFFVVGGSVLLIAVVQEFIHQSKTPKLRLLSGFSFVLVSLAFSGIPFDLSSFIDFRALYLFAGLMFVALYVYFTRVSTHLSRVALARSFFYLGLFVSIQVFLFYIDAPDVLQAISDRELLLAWGNPNSIAIILLMTIPMSMYLLSERRALFVLFPFIILQLVTLLFTLSRGSLLSFVIMFPFFMYLLVRESRHKIAALLVIFIAFGMVFLIQKMYPSEMTLLFERFATAGFDDSGRFELFAQGLSYFFQNPIFGVGFELPTLEYGSLVHFHSTFIQMAAYAGIFGLLAIVIHFDQKYTLVFKQKNHFFHWVGMVLLTTDLYGMIDVTYFSFIYMVYLGVLLGVTDSNAQLELANNIQSTEIGA